MRPDDAATKPSNKSLCLRLLIEYQNHPEGLTDDAAAVFAGLGHTNGFWKRCSDLRNDGFIDVVRDERGYAVLEMARAGRKARVCTVTHSGMIYLEMMK